MLEAGLVGRFAQLGIVVTGDGNADRGVERALAPHGAGQRQPAHRFAQRNIGNDGARGELCGDLERRRPVVGGAHQRADRSSKAFITTVMSR